MEKIYVISHDNEDVRIGLISFKNQQEAVDKASGLAKTFCRDVKCYQEIDDKDFVFFAKYSAECEGVAVVEVNIDLNPKGVEKLKTIPYMDEIMLREFFARVYFLWGRRENVNKILSVEKATTSSMINGYPFSAFELDDTTYFIKYRSDSISGKSWEFLAASQEEINNQRGLRLGGLRARQA